MAKAAEPELTGMVGWLTAYVKAWNEATMPLLRSFEIMVRQISQAVPDADDLMRALIAPDEARHRPGDPEW